MAEENLKTCTFRILRYVPNLLRDEWMNIGVLLADPGGQLYAQLLQDEADFARVRRLHPDADITVLRALAADLQERAGRPGEAAALLAGFDETLSNALQLGPQKAVLTTNAEAELARLFHDQVEPTVYRSAGAAEREPNRAVIRRQAREILRRNHLDSSLRFSVHVDEFTSPGDPFRLDFGWRNGVRGYLHSVPLARDAGQAKVLAFTADAVRAREPEAEFVAVTEGSPQSGNRRHAFVSGLFDAHRIEMVPLAGLDHFARKLRGRLA